MCNAPITIAQWLLSIALQTALSVHTLLDVRNEIERNRENEGRPTKEAKNVQIEFRAAQEL